MLRWDWRPACERRGGVWECVCTTVLWGRGLYNDFELFFFFLGEGWYNYSTLAYLTRNPRAVCAAIFVLAHDLRTLSVAVHEIAFRRTAFATARRAAACLLRTRCGAARPSVSSWPRSRRGRRNGAAGGCREAGGCGRLSAAARRSPRPAAGRRRRPAARRTSARRPSATPWRLLRPSSGRSQLPCRFFFFFLSFFWFSFTPHKWIHHQGLGYLYFLKIK